MKFTWGTGIALFYSVFALVFIILVVKSTTVDNSLVVEEYYKEDLAYQAHFDKKENAMNLKTDLKIRSDAGSRTVQFVFPATEGQAAGKILFFRPSNSQLDFELDIRPDPSNIYTYPTEKMAPGLWEVKVNWEAAGKAFYTEETIVL